MQERLKGKWQFLYSFSEEDLERPGVKSFREIVLETADTLIVSEKKIMQEFMEGKWENCLLLISSCQEEAIAFGHAIEEKKERVPRRFLFWRSIVRHCIMRIKG